MQEEYVFNLTLPADEAEAAERLLDEARQIRPTLRYTRKSDRHGMARYYLRFPLDTARPDLAFKTWFDERSPAVWELEGPQYGRWGFA